ncbi:MAG: hypothetical protein ACPLPR_01350 [Bacillota bacterium]
MVRIAIDLGHGYVKGLSDTGRTLLMPSVVGDGYEHRVVDTFGISQGRREYEVVVDGRRYFVGKLAVAESWNATRAFDESRVCHHFTAVLYGAATVLLAHDRPGALHVAAGLPFELYKTQKGELLQMLSTMRADVEVCGAGRRKVYFDRVTVVPQAVGAFYSAVLDERGRASDLGQSLLREGGLAAVVDCGYKTTDFLLVDLGSLDIIESGCGTVNMAMSDVVSAVQHRVQEIVGDVVDVLQVEQAMERGKLWFRGREYRLGELCEESAEVLAEAVAERLRMTWKDRGKYLRVLFLAGGGAKVLEGALSRRQFPVQLLPDAQFANARGFLNLAARREAAAQATATA